MSATLINLYAGPGAGKSTTAAGVFYELKMAGHNAELAHEYAKDLTWEGRTSKLGCQPAIAGEQIWRIERLMEQVDFIVCDSPILFCAYYDKRNSAVAKAFEEFLRWQHMVWQPMDFFLIRDADREYNPAGRNQTLGQAMMADDEINEKMMEWGLDWEEVPMGTLEDQTVAQYITQQVLRYRT